MLEPLKVSVCNANLELVRRGIVIYTWGNVSAIDRETGYVVIKPSGISYEGMVADDMVVVDLNGGIIEGKWRPSSDTKTHLELYKVCKDIGGIVHTHSIHAVAFAQAGMSIPALGTTHADYFYGEIPCTRALSEREVKEDYEKNTGLVILESIDKNDALKIPGCVVKNHGPFAWGKDAESAVHNAVVMETVAEMAIKTLQLNQNAKVDQYILDKHYNRKHGKNAYYGQR